MDWLIPWWGWFLFGFALLGLEMAAPGGFYFMFFGTGAVLVGVLAWTGLLSEAWVELTLFSAFSVVSSLFFRKPLLARFGAKPSEAVIDSLVGETGTVIDDIDPGAFGKVELRGSAWRAKNIGDGTLKRGDRGRVGQVDGLVLWIRREES